jgi:hypothetical protein
MDVSMKQIHSDVDLSPAIRSLNQRLLILSAFSIALGLFGLFRDGFQAAGFSMALITLGVATLYIRIPAMLPIFSVVFFWLAIRSIYEFSFWSLGFAILELIAGIVMFNFFRIYSHIQENDIIDYFRIDSPSLRLTPAISRFPLFSALMGSAAVIEFAAFIIMAAAVVNASIGQPFWQIRQAVSSYSYILYFLEPFVIFAFALGLSSLLVRQQPRLLGANGMILGGTLLLAFISIIMVSVFIPSP